MRLQIDPVPKITAGVRTVGCKCGWEAAFIVPEEDDLVVAVILDHLRTKHELDVPSFWGLTH